jgi:hypothetical protein
MRFASVEEAADALGRRDAFVESLSRFDLEVRLQTDQPVEPKDLVEFARRQVVAWRPEQIEHVSAVIESVRAKLAGLRQCLPPETLLIQTTGREEGNAAYTRGTAIILPTDKAALPRERLERLVLHELFHVISRHNLNLRAELYRMIGFEVAEEIALPPALRNRKITNPDAPKIDCRITLDHQGRQADFAPVLLASPPQYDAEMGGSIFNYLTFRLIEVEPHEGSWRVALRDGEPTLVDPSQTPAFFERIGRNTKYIIHPDEILADNFVLMATDAEALATPGIVDAMRRELIRPND